MSYIINEKEDKRECCELITLTNYVVVGLKYLFISFIGSIIIYILFNKFLNRKIITIKFKTFIRIWYVVFVVFVCFADRKIFGARAYNLIPLLSFKQAISQFSAENWLNILLNIILFIPFGILFYPSNNKEKICIFTMGTASVLLIEIIQYTFHLGIADIDDVIYNIIGIVIGYNIISIIVKKTIREKIMHTVLAVIPLLIFAGVAINYWMQPIGNIEYDYDYKLNLENVEIIIDEDLYDELPETYCIYRINKGSKEDALNLADIVFHANGTIIGSDIYQYDDCIVIYDKKRKLNVWYNYLTSTYIIQDFQRENSDQDFLNRVTREEVEFALQKIGIIVPVNSEFSLLENKFIFSVYFQEQSGVIYDGNLTCTYFNGKVHEVKNNIFEMNLCGIYQALTEDELDECIRKGKMSISFLPDVSNLKCIEIIDGHLVYLVDSKGYYRPVYQFNSRVNGEKCDLYITL